MNNYSTEYIPGIQQILKITLTERNNQHFLIDFINKNNGFAFKKWMKYYLIIITMKKI